MYDCTAGGEVLVIAEMQLTGVQIHCILIPPQMIIECS